MSAGKETKELYWDLSYREVRSSVSHYKWNCFPTLLLTTADKVDYLFICQRLIPPAPHWIVHWCCGRIQFRLLWESPQNSSNVLGMFSACSFGGKIPVCLPSVFSATVARRQVKTSFVSLMSFPPCLRANSLLITRLFFVRLSLLPGINSKRSQPLCWSLLYSQQQIPGPLPADRDSFKEVSASPQWQRLYGGEPHTRGDPRLEA